MEIITIRQRRSVRTFSLKTWLNRKNELNSALLGETVTNSQTLKVNNALLAFFLQQIRIPFKSLGLWTYFTGHSGWDGVLWGLIFVFMCWCITLYCNKKNWFWKF